MFYEGPAPGEKRKYEFPLSNAQNKLYRCLRARQFPDDLAMMIIMLPSKYGWEFCHRVESFSPESVIRVSTRLYIASGPDVSGRLKEIVDFIAYRWFLSETMSVLVSMCDSPPLAIVRCVAESGLLLNPRKIAVFLVEHGITTCSLDRHVELRPAESEILAGCAKKLGLVRSDADA